MGAVSVAVLSNARARRLFLDRHALIEPPTGPAKGEALLDLIRRLGFVQVDSINTVERAHHMILWSRRQSYRPENLRRLLEKDRLLFEHWTHDASIIPVEYFPWWKVRFRRDADRLMASYTGWKGSEFHARIDDVLAHVRSHGPVGSGDVGEEELRTPGLWNWHPSKTAMEYLWRIGVLSVRERRSFAKVYDLTERVHPAAHAADCPTEDETIDWACNAALDRLAFATSGEIAAFFAKVRPEEARSWCETEKAAGRIIEVGVELADGSVRRVFARPDLPDLPEPAPGQRLRILSPFDPALRDRNRAYRLFGFHYRIEIFVPEPKRTYGYYVFPILEGDRITGRIDVRARRTEGDLMVAAWWPEPGIRMTAARLSRIEAELARLATFSGCERVRFADGWQRETLRRPT